jgi:iron only hydrogenase large subunit-like protein
MAADSGRRIYSVTIMPCTVKKYEAVDVGDLDAVLTTCELYRLLDHFGLKLSADSALRSTPDAPFAEARGTSRLFGGSGGVLEATLRTAAHMVGASAPLNTFAISPLRSDERSEPSPVP